MKTLAILTTLLICIFSVHGVEKCDHQNYLEYIYSAEKTDGLISKTKKGCSLSGIYLIEADLREALFIEADLSWADFSRADLRGANFRGADLIGAYLTGADLREAILRGVDLRGVDLTWADLREADLREADLSLVFLRGTKYNAYTKFPKGFDPEQTDMAFMGPTKEAN